MFAKDRRKVAIEELAWLIKWNLVKMLFFSFISLDKIHVNVSQAISQVICAVGVLVVRTLHSGS